MCQFMCDLLLTLASRLSTLRTNVELTIKIMTFKYFAGKRRSFAKKNRVKLPNKIMSTVKMDAITEENPLNIIKGR